MNNFELDRLFLDMLFSKMLSFIKVAKKSIPLCLKHKFTGIQMVYSIYIN